MDWNYLFTSFDGRISRQPFWIGTLVLWVASLVVSFVAVRSSDAASSARSSRP